MMKRNFFLLVVIFSTGILKAQNGEIAGKITAKNAEGISKVKVVVTDTTGNIIGKAAISDNDGNFSLKPLIPGKYNLEFSCRGYLSLTERGVIVSSNRATFINVQLEFVSNPQKKGTK